MKFIINYFQSYLSKRQFKFLISKATRKEIWDNNILIQQGNLFDDLMLISKIPSTSKLILTSNELPLPNPPEGSFLGIYQAIQLLRQERSKKVVLEDEENTEVQKLESRRINNYFHQEIRWDLHAKTEGEGIIIYKWEKSDLIEILEDNQGTMILNALWTIWSYYIRSKVEFATDEKQIILKDKRKKKRKSRSRAKRYERFERSNSVHLQSKTTHSEKEK